VPAGHAVRPRAPSSARAVLQLLTLLARTPGGMKADEVATALGRSTSTAYSLLQTLCDEGFAVHERGAYVLTRDAAELADIDRDARLPAGLEGVVEELLARTHKRAYLAAARSGRIVVPLVRGRQGMPRMPGLGTQIRDNAHALALGKVALSLLDDDALERYLARGLRAFTPHTIVDPDVLREQLDDIRAGGVANDREELAEDFCCFAAPIRNARGGAVAALGISMSLRCFETEGEQLELRVAEVADEASRALGHTTGVPALPEDASVLEQAARPVLRSPYFAAHTDGRTGEDVTS
jgi:DNA-binding IclR family transcriptional regulator